MIRRKWRRILRIKLSKEQIKKRKDSKTISHLKFVSNPIKILDKIRKRRQRRKRNNSF